MFNQTETAERSYLEHIVKKLHQALEEADAQVSAAYKEVIEAKKYLWLNLSQLDPAERAANRVDIALSIDHGEKRIVLRRKLRKLIQSPYFGRVDFAEDEQPEPDVYYIGVHSFADEATQNNLIYDWRSPVASMFYDYNAGKASYTAPAGTIEGEIRNKRQYKIKNGVMEYMIESSMNINDEVLQKELSTTSDEKMKNIVATIQKEQNVIIRNEASKELIVQGVAGSGKTSVALHRVAYLLYKFKETLTSRNILIISPNKVFSDYISNVLPELGEENIVEIHVEEIAAKELAGLSQFQTFNEQVAELVEAGDEEQIARIRFKADMDFVHQLDAYLAHVDAEYFRPADMDVDGLFISGEQLHNAYRASLALPIQQRLDKTASSVIGSARDKEGQRPTPAAAKRMKAAIHKMFRFQDALSLYREFCNHIGKPERFRWKKNKTLEYADVFPLIYVKLHFEGADSFDFIKHLLVDEMQDYTPIQYAVFAKLFRCKKTILGDAAQSVNPYASSTLAEIKKVFPEAETVELLKSYRSTIEITRFAQKLKRDSKIIPIERHGEEPRIAACESAQGEREAILKLCRDFLASEHRSLGIVCKTQAQAERLHKDIKPAIPDARLLDFGSEQFHEGVVVTFAHMAKGLEFDRVIVPFADAATYRSELDCSLLYVACTRAMHQLVLTYHGKLTPMLECEPI